MSSPSSITFFGDKGECEVDTIDHNLPPKYTTSKPYRLTKHVKNIPIIRGYTLMVDLIFQLIRLIFTNKLWLLVLGIVLFTTFFKPEVVIEIKEVKSSPLTSIIPYQFWDHWVPIALYLLVLGFVFLATKNHAAEHKVISAYENNQNLSLRNINLQPKENRRCGTVLIVWFLVISAPIFFLPINEWAKNFLQFTAFSFAYEIFQLARRDDTIGQLVYSLGWLGQKLTTREPDIKLLTRSREGLMRLLDEEGYRYRK